MMSVPRSSAGREQSPPREARMRRGRCPILTPRPQISRPRSIGEFIPGYEVSSWYGVGAPKDTPAEVIDKLNKEISEALADPKVKARLADLGGTVFVMSPSDLGKFIAEDTEKWAKVLREANLKRSSQ
jgi:hypothetical protein